ncbi:MAG TPA: menaquinone biosynthesis protein [Candidatus Acidoferrales bacterium]|nr:menaquinone biosynthesis protein [Candidatus Acidoferrales bacterium]
MTKLRVSVVEYLNTAPLVWGFTDGGLGGGYELDFTLPSLCAEALRSGRADIGIIPAIEYQRMEDVVAFDGMAIAAKREVRSILIVARRPIERVRTMALDTSSRSSTAMVKVLGRRRWNIEPEYIDAAPNPQAMLERADAALVIGDPALRLAVKIDALHAKKPVAGGACCLGDADELPVPGVSILFVYDVVAEWRAWTGLPAVLALWAARREVATPKVVEDFLASKAYGLEHVNDIARQAADELDIPEPAIETYLRENVNFDLDAANLAGLERYYQECADASLIARVRPLELVRATSAAAGERQGTKR